MDDRAEKLKRLFDQGDKAFRDLEEVFEAWGNSEGVDAMRKAQADWKRLRDKSQKP
jgi:hypothetical protein